MYLNLTALPACKMITLFCQIPSQYTSSDEYYVINSQALPNFIKYLVGKYLTR